MQTHNNADTAGMRYKDLTPYEVTLIIQEDQSADDETKTEVAESVGYLALWIGVRVNETIDNEPEPTENMHYIQPFPLFDSIIYVKTIFFDKNVIENMNEFYTLVYEGNTENEDGYCEAQVDDMLRVSN